MKIHNKLIKSKTVTEKTDLWDNFITTILTRTGLHICLLRGLMEEQIAEARSMGLTTNYLPEASLGDVDAGKFQLLFSSVFSCAVSGSLEFSVIFLLSKYTDCPNCRYSLRRDCKRDLKNFRHVRWKCQSFSKLANTTSRQSFCWKA